MDSKKVRNSLRWVARIWGSAIAAFVLFFLIMDLLSGGTAEGISSNEMLTFICFPLSPIIGFIIAWKWEFLGGLIVLAGMIGLSILRPDLITNFLLIGVVLLPGLIFIWLGWPKSIT
ncbi:MAG: hypothetical protein HKN89_07870 [Eudoraea sp.]|nr:hypothetical protein [Eudoraea sp.]